MAVGSACFAPEFPLVVPDRNPVRTAPSGLFRGRGEVAASPTRPSEIADCPASPAQRDGHSSIQIRDLPHLLKLKFAKTVLMGHYDFQREVQIGQQSKEAWRKSIVGLEPRGACHLNFQMKALNTRERRHPGYKFGLIAQKFLKRVRKTKKDAIVVDGNLCGETRDLVLHQGAGLEHGFPFVKDLAHFPRKLADQRFNIQTFPLASQLTAYHVLFPFV